MKILGYTVDVCIGRRHFLFGYTNSLGGTYHRLYFGPLYVSWFKVEKVIKDYCQA